MIKIGINQSLWIAISLFALYFMNVIWGKLSVVFFGHSVPSGIGNIAEFLLLVLASIFFVITILKAEHLREK